MAGQLAGPEQFLNDEAVIWKSNQIFTKSDPLGDASRKRHRPFDFQNGGKSLSSPNIPSCPLSSCFFFLSGLSVGFSGSSSSVTSSEREGSLFLTLLMRLSKRHAFILSESKGNEVYRRLSWISWLKPPLIILFLDDDRHTVTTGLFKKQFVVLRPYEEFALCSPPLQSAPILHLNIREIRRMKISRLLMAGVGLGIGALAFRKKRSCRDRSGEEHFNEHDATLLGLKANQHDVGSPTQSHIKEGIGRTIQTPAV